MKKGQAMPEALKRNLSKLNSGENHPRFGKHCSEETKKKIRESLLGHVVTEETRRKISEPQIGKVGYWKDKSRSKDTRKKISKSLSGENSPNFGKCGELCPLYGRYGEQSNNWRGGISFEPYSPDWVESLKDSIRQRDHHTCRLCGKIWEPGMKSFPVHHIDYDKKHCDPNNLITLCPGCHTKTNGNRKYWIECFRKLDRIFDC